MVTYIKLLKSQIISRGTTTTDNKGGGIDYAGGPRRARDRTHGHARQRCGAAGRVRRAPAPPARPRGRAALRAARAAPTPTRPHTRRSE